MKAEVYKFGSLWFFDCLNCIRDHPDISVYPDASKSWQEAMELATSHMRVLHSGQTNTHQQ